MCAISPLLLKAQQGGGKNQQSFSFCGVCILVGELGRILKSSRFIYHALSVCAYQWAIWLVPKIRNHDHVWWCTLGNLAQRGGSSEDQAFKASFDYILSWRLGLAWATRNPISKNQCQYNWWANNEPSSILRLPGLPSRLHIFTFLIVLSPPQQD